MIVTSTGPFSGPGSEFSACGAQCCDGVRSRSWVSLIGRKRPATAVSSNPPAATIKAVEVFEYAVTVPQIAPPIPNAPWNAMSWTAELRALTHFGYACCPATLKLEMVISHDEPAMNNAIIMDVRSRSIATDAIAAVEMHAVSR